MVVILHAVVALISIFMATVTFFHPSKQRFFVSYSLIAATLFSGFYLALSNPAHMVHVCLSGSIYLAVISVATTAAHVRFKKLQES